MQSDWKELYRITSERTSKPVELYKDLGNFVFAETAKLLRKPQSIILKLKGVGSWYLRKNRMRLWIGNKTVENMPREESDFDSPVTWAEYKDRRDMIEMLRARLKDYDAYIQLRDETRLVRWQTQTIIKPIDRSNDN